LIEAQKFIWFRASVIWQVSSLVILGIQGWRRCKWGKSKLLHICFSVLMILLREYFFDRIYRLYLFIFGPNNFFKSLIMTNLPATNLGLFPRIHNAINLLTCFWVFLYVSFDASFMF